MKKINSNKGCMPSDHDYTTGREINGEYKIRTDIKIGGKVVYDQTHRHVFNPDGSYKEKVEYTQNRIWFCVFAECDWEGWVLGWKELGGKCLKNNTQAVGRSG